MEDNYFENYDNLEIHRIMLMDNIRVITYKEAIFNKVADVKGKVVLDVGAGSGLLSIMCAMAGASKVYANEACSQIVPLLRKTISENELSPIIEIIEGDVEQIELKEKVDIIVSEWMGFYLLHECMLKSVLHARDHFLKPTGKMLPDTCEIFVALCKDATHYHFWENVHGVKMTNAGASFRILRENTPKICFVDEKDIVSEREPFFVGNLYNLKVAELDDIRNQITFVSKYDTECNGICFWFDVLFNNIVLSTSPFTPKTHWKQAVTLFAQPITLRCGDMITFEIIFKQDTRNYIISAEHINN